MKIKLVFILFMIYSLNLFGQTNESGFIGKWIKFKVEMRDGSKLLPRPYADSTYYEFNISNTRIAINSYPIYKMGSGGMNYTLDGNYLRTSPTSGYTVEKISQDTLVLCEKIDGMTNDKMKCFYLTKEKIVLQQYIEKMKDKKEIIASQFYTPKLIGDIQGSIFKKFGEDISNFNVSGNIKITSDKVIHTEIIQSSTKNLDKLKVISEVINNSYEKWNLDGFANYESIIIPFVLKSERTETYRGIKMAFHTYKLEDLERNYGIKRQDAMESAEFYKKGFEAYESKKFIKAAEFFSKSFKIDPQNIDALYNQAVALYDGGDKLGACKVWQQLVELGQTLGKQYYKDNCK